MDQTDLAIFSRLVANAFLSDEALGREVGITGKAVRLRRRRMEAKGVLQEYGVHPAPEVLGRHAVTWRYVGKEWTERTASALAQVEDLVFVMSFRPAFHRVVRFAREPDVPADPRLGRVLGQPVGGLAGEREPAFSLRSDDLTRVDWTVLEAVVGAPRATYVKMARQARITPRTLRRHRTRLEASHALQCAMILDLGREAGLATYGLWLKVDAAFDERCLDWLRLWDRPHWTREPRGVYLLGSGETYFEAREIELRLRSLPGVLSADPLIPAGGYFARDRLLAWIRAERERRFPRADRATVLRPPPARRRQEAPAGR